MLTAVARGEPAHATPDGNTTTIPGALETSTNARTVTGVASIIAETQTGHIIAAVVLVFRRLEKDVMILMSATAGTEDVVTCAKT